MTEHSTDSKYMVLMDDAPDGELSTMQVIFGLDALCTAIEKTIWEMGAPEHEGVCVHSLVAIAKNHAKRLSNAVIDAPPSVHAVDQSRGARHEQETGNEYTT